MIKLFEQGGKIWIIGIFIVSIIAIMKSRAILIPILLSIVFFHELGHLIFIFIFKKKLSKIVIFPPRVNYDDLDNKKGKTLIYLGGLILTLPFIPVLIFITNFNPLWSFLTIILPCYFDIKEIFS